MNILADENVPRIVVIALRESGHAVKWVTEEASGTTDAEIMQLANTYECLLLTFDLDFGELVFRLRISLPHGIILLRIPLLLPDQMAHFIVQTLASRDDWAKHFSVIEPHKIRMINISNFSDDGQQ